METWHSVKEYKVYNKSNKAQEDDKMYLDQGRVLCGNWNIIVWNICIYIYINTHKNIYINIYIYIYSEYIYLYIYIVNKKNEK